MSVYRTISFSVLRAHKRRKSNYAIRKIIYSKSSPEAVEMLSGAKFGWDPEDANSLLGMLANGNYESMETDILLGIVKNENIKCVFDIGANFGWYSIQIANAAKGAAMIHAFEPSPDAYGELASNIALNGLANRIIANRTCLGEASGMTKLYIPKDLGSAFASMNLDNYRGDKEVIDVPVSTIDDYCKSNGIGCVDLIKIDVEGAEFNVFKGAASMFAKKNKPIIMMEAQKQSTVNFGYLPKDVFGFLLSHGYVIYDIMSSSVVNDHDDLKGYNFLCYIPGQHDHVPSIISSPKKLLKAQPGDYEGRIREVINDKNNRCIPRVSDAGEVNEDHQIMHNGLKVGIKEEAYYGEWITRLLRMNKGVHEPQEERVFQEVLKLMPDNGIMLELGSYWAFYSMWFNMRVNNAINYMVEPDEGRLEIGRRNFKRNGMKGEFIKGGIGDNDVIIDEFLDEKRIEFLHLLHADIQGAEMKMLKGAEKSLSAARIGYIFISSHSQKLHKECIAFLRDNGYVIIASADYDRGTSGHDGLIVARPEKMEGLKPLKIWLRS